MSLPPLPDLHRHLDGSLRLSTLRELADAVGVPVPEDVRFKVGMGLDDALAGFELTLSVLQTPEPVKRVASEICEDAAADGVTTLEIRFAPQLHKGASIEEITDAALDGIDGRAGLILCGLYGDSPFQLEVLVEVARNRPGVVGIDLAGGPAPNHEWELEHYREAFLHARRIGLGRTVHAGEGRPPEEIRAAIELLDAERIGHGTTLLDDPEVLEMVVERGIVIEACPTSNVHTGIIGSVAEHPLGRWMAEGVRVCVNTDNTLFSDVSASQEWENVRLIDGVDDAVLARMILIGHGAAFHRG